MLRLHYSIYMQGVSFFLSLFGFVPRKRALNSGPGPCRLEKYRKMRCYASANLQPTSAMGWENPLCCLLSDGLSAPQDMEASLPNSLITLGHVRTLN